MQTDYAVELGREDETLEMPWAAPDGSIRYYDLKREPQMLGKIEEAVRIEELREFLCAVNEPTSILESAKCDAWSSNEIHPEEEIFGKPWKFASYVDLVLTNPASRFSFEEHENLLKDLITLLHETPEAPASAEFLLRRCYYHEKESVHDGFYITFYLFGYGEQEPEARQQWAKALAQVSDALARLSAGFE